MCSHASTTRREKHPLFNPVILERIFEVLNVDSLKSVRLVCKFWNKIGGPFLQNASQVILIRGMDSDSKRFSYKNFISCIEPIPREEIFFRNYHIEYWILNERREKTLLLFWVKCGPSMKELYLRDIIFYEVQTIRNVLFYWTPCLESLTLEDCLFYTITEENIKSTSSRAYSEKEDFDEEYVFFDYYDHVKVEQLKDIKRDPSVPCNLNLKRFVYDQLEEEIFPLAWDELFSAFSNLKKIRLSASLSESQVSDILANVFCMSVTSLEFFKPNAGKKSSQIADSHLIQISQLNTQLTNLELFLNDKNISLQALFIAIKRHNVSLKSLKLFLEEESDSAKTKLITACNATLFPNLASLTLSSELLSTESFINCLQNMTKLKWIKFWDASNDEFNWETQLNDLFVENDNDESNPDVKRFLKIEKFSCGYNLKSSQFFPQLSTHFPNLKVLEAPLSDSQIRIIFANLKLLEEITVYERYLSDAGITGNPNFLVEHEEWNPTTQRQFPYIGDLKRLKRFTLTYCKYNNITDLSVYHGFMDVTNLCYLRLTTTCIHTSALQSLVLKSSLVTLISPTVSKGHVLLNPCDEMQLILQLHG